jgi:hypothetical protein
MTVSDAIAASASAAPSRPSARPTATASAADEPSPAPVGRLKRSVRSRRTPGPREQLEIRARQRRVVGRICGIDHDVPLRDGEPPAARPRVDLDAVGERARQRRMAVHHRVLAQQDHLAVGREFLLHSV